MTIFQLTTPFVYECAICVITQHDFFNPIEEADINIRKIQNATEEIELENIQITKEFLDQYYSTKEELREARQMLRKLAEKTVSACKDIKVLIESWEDTSTVYVEKQFSIMKQLLKESAPILEQGKSYQFKKMIHDGMN